MTKLNQLVILGALLAGAQASADPDAAKPKHVPGAANSPLIYCPDNNPANDALHLKYANLSPTTLHKAGQEISLNITGEFTRRVNQGGIYRLAITSPDGKNPVYVSTSPVAENPPGPLELVLGSAIPKDAAAGHYLVRLNITGGDAEPVTCIQGLVDYDP